MAYLFLDERSGAIVREQLRDGKRVVTTTFDRFETADGETRPRHWTVDDGRKETRLDVTVESEAAAASPADVASASQKRIFGSTAGRLETAYLPADFDRGTLYLRTMIGATPRRLLLDTGTAGIIVDPYVANRFGGATLEHSELPKITVGPLSLDRASVLVVPLFADGILGLDFFLGHTIEIDYPGRRVRVLSEDDADRTFADRDTSTVPIDITPGLPLGHAAFGTAASDSFAIDTGSPRLHVMRPFETQFAAEIALHWTPFGAPFVESYLEGSIELQTSKSQSSRSRASRHATFWSGNKYLRTKRTTWIFRTTVLSARTFLAIMTSTSTTITSGWVYERSL